jgi:hypothetical protein
MVVVRDNTLNEKAKKFFEKFVSRKNNRVAPPDTDFIVASAFTAPSAGPSADVQHGNPSPSDSDMQLYTEEELREREENQDWEARMARLLAAIPTSHLTNRVLSPFPSWDDEVNDLSQFGAAALPTGNTERRPTDQSGPAPPNISGANAVFHLPDPHSTDEFGSNPFDNPPNVSWDSRTDPLDSQHSVEDNNTGMPINLRDANKEIGKERAEFIRNQPTLLEDFEITFNSNSRPEPFFTIYGHKNIEDVPMDELIDEIQFQRICHYKPRYPDSVMIEELNVLLESRPEIRTVSELFRFLKFKTYHTPRTSPTHEPAPVRPSAPLITRTDVGVNCVVDTADAAVSCVVDTADAAVTCSIVPDTLANPTQPLVTRGGFAPIPFAASTPHPRLGHPTPILHNLDNTQQTGKILIKRTYAGPIASLGSSNELAPVTTAASTTTVTTSGTTATPGCTPQVPRGDRAPSANRKVSFGPTTSTPAPGMYSTPVPNQINQQGFADTSRHRGFIPSAASTIPSSFSSEFSRIYRELTDMGLSHADAANCAAARVTQPSNVTNRATPPPTQSTTTFSQPITPTPSQPACYTPAPPPNNTLDQSVQEQKQAITLIAAVPPFSGSGSTRFETWIKHFESQLDTAEFEESRKIKLLCSRLSNDALECVLTYKQKNPISANVYENIKSCLFDRFHGSETRTRYFTEFQNCTRHPGETVRNYACRLQKLLLHAYPIPPGGRSASENAMSEKLLMDKFINGLSRKLQAMLKHKEYPSFDVLIKKTEARVACEEDFADETIHAVTSYSNRPHAPAPDRELGSVAEAVSRLCSSVEQSLAIQTEELQRNLRQLRDAAPARRAGFNNQHAQHRQSANLQYCDFHNEYVNHNTENCLTKQALANAWCKICNKQGHSLHYCPTRRNPRPQPPPGYSNPRSQEPLQNSEN